MHTYACASFTLVLRISPLCLTSMSQIVGFTFGSFGDILSILQLVRTVQRLLSDSLGASSEYQDPLLELDRTLRVLHLVQGVTTPRHGSGSLSINTHEDLRLSISRCRIVIFDLYVRIQKFRESLRKGGSGSRMRDSWRKIGWGLFKVDELVDIRRKLKDEGDVITTLLDVSNSYVEFPSSEFGVRIPHISSTMAHIVWPSVESRIPCVNHKRRCSKSSTASRKFRRSWAITGREDLLSEIDPLS